MGLETGTYISDLNTANPSGTDPKSQGDDHLRWIKSAVKTTFPNITGAVTPTHTELNYVDGVTSAIQTQIDAKGAITGQAWTGSHTFPTQAAGNNSTKAATTAYVDAADALKANLASPALTGTPTAPTASPGTNTTQVATTAFATQLAFQAALPVQSGAAGKFLTTDGTNASWSNLLDQGSALSADYALLVGDRYKALALSGSHTLSLPAAATAGDGFRFWVHNGTGTWTIDPNGSELIEGRTTIKVYPGESFAVICNGSAWFCFGRPSRVLLYSAGATSGAVNFDIETPFADTEIVKHDLTVMNALSAGVVALQVKKGGSYLTTNYHGEILYDSSGFASAAWTTYVQLSALGGFSGTLDIFGAAETGAGYPRFAGVIIDTGGGGTGASPPSITGGIQAVDTGATEGIRLLSTSGNLSFSSLKLWGERL